MKNFDIPKDVQKLHDALTVERAEYAKAQEKVQAAYKKWEKKFTNWMMRAFTASDEKLAFIMHPDFGDTGGMEYYNASCKYVRDRYGFGAQLSGVNSYTRQRVLKLMFDKDDAEINAKIRQAIDEALPHIIPFTADMKDIYDRPIASEMVGYCYFDIMERGLSQYASYDILVSPIDKTIVIKTQRYSTTKYSEPMEYDAGLAYLAKNLYYESSDSSDDDED